MLYLPTAHYQTQHLAHGLRKYTLGREVADWWQIGKKKKKALRSK